MEPGVSERIVELFFAELERSEQGGPELVDWLRRLHDEGEMHAEKTLVEVYERLAREEL